MEFFFSIRFTLIGEIALSKFIIFARQLKAVFQLSRELVYVVPEVYIYTRIYYYFFAFEFPQKSFQQSTTRFVHSESLNGTSSTRHICINKSMY